MSSRSSHTTALRVKGKICRGWSLTVNLQGDLPAFDSKSIRLRTTHPVRNRYDNRKRCGSLATPTTSASKSKKSKKRTADSSPKSRAAKRTKTNSTSHQALNDGTSTQVEGDDERTTLRPNPSPKAKSSRLSKSAVTCRKFSPFPCSVRMPPSTSSIEIVSSSIMPIGR